MQGVHPQRRCYFFINASAHGGGTPPWILPPPPPQKNPNFHIWGLVLGTWGWGDLEKTPKENRGQILTQIRGILMGFIKGFSIFMIPEHKVFQLFRHVFIFLAFPSLQDLSPRTQNQKWVWKAGTTNPELTSWPNWSKFSKAPPCFRCFSGSPFSADQVFPGSEKFCKNIHIGFPIFSARFQIPGLSQPPASITTDAKSKMNMKSRDNKAWEYQATLL